MKPEDCGSFYRLSRIFLFSAPPFIVRRRANQLRRIMKKYLEILKIVSIHGVKGEINAQAWCDSPSQITKLKKLYSKDGSKVYELLRARPKSDSMVIIKLRGIDSPEDAQNLRNTVLYADRDDIKLPDGSYFIQDLVGLECFSETGELLGTLSDVLSTGANDVYEITCGDKKYYIPAVPSVILNTDIAGGRMDIIKMEGLFDED